MSDDSNDTRAEGACGGPRPAPPSHHAPWLIHGLGLTIANAVLVLLFLWATRLLPARYQWWLQAAAGSAPVIFTGLYVSIHQLKHWERPTELLAELLAEVRAGDRPIDDLSQVTGGPAPVVDEVRRLLQDLRSKRAELAKLEMEISARVANRTNALERTLGALQQQASRDALTGVHNRRMLEQCFADLVARVRAERGTMTIMMIDVDDFKLLNDTLGHAAGDEFLRALGQLLRSTLRETDYAFRYGGDEFVVVLPNTARPHAETSSERLASLVEGLTRTYRVARPPRLSIGLLDITALPPDSPANAILAEADRLLYEVKQARKAKRAAAGLPARVA